MAILGRKNKKPEQRQAITASAARVRIGDRVSTETLRRRTDERWQKEAWGYYDDVGEVKYSAQFLANAIARLEIFPARRPELGKDPERVEDRDASEILADLASPIDGFSALLYDLAVNFTVPGECFLTGLEQRTTRTEQGTSLTIEAGWDVKSVDEVTVDGDTVKVHGVASAEGDVIPTVTLTEQDYMARLWQPHARWGMRADSPLHGVLAQCEELLTIDRSIRAAARSRLAGNGLLILPDEITFQPRDPTQKEGGEAGTTDDFWKEFLEHVTAPIADEGDASAVVPYLIRMKGEYIEKARHLTFERAVDKDLVARTERALRRLAQGLNVPPEVVTGLADVNHWTAWQIDEATVKSHVVPLARVVCEALTKGFLRPALIAQGRADVDLVVWFDPAALIRRPDPVKDAEEAHARLLISDKALRERYGISEDDRITDEEEMARRVALSKGSLDPMQTERLLQDLFAMIEARLPAPTPAPSPTPPPAEGDDEPEEGPPSMPDPADVEDDVDAVAAAGNGRTLVHASGRATMFATTATDRRHLGAQLLDVDRALRSRIEGAVEAATGRMLERAGAKLKSKARKDRNLSDAIRGADPEEIPSILGPERVAWLGVDDDELIAGAWSKLGAQFLQWTADAQAQALALVGVRPGDREDLEVRQTEDRLEAWAWLEDKLNAHGRDLVYDPNPKPPEQGETDGSVRVPFRLIREAVARAGGAVGQSGITAALDIPVAAIAHGVGTGGVVQEVLAEQGGAVASYEWVYGAYPRQRPFEPHAELDGATFENFDDPLLSNGDSFPPEPFYAPGDHNGCRCDFLPVFVGEGGEVIVDPLTEPGSVPPEQVAATPEAVTLEPQGLAASRAIQDLDMAPGMRDALSAVDDVHGLGPVSSVPRIYALQDNRMRRLGVYEYTGDGRPYRIRIKGGKAQPAGEQALTAAHEFGHYLDHAFLTGGPQFGKWFSSSPAAQAFRDAVNNTATVKRIRELRAAGDTVLEAGGRRYNYTRRFTSYLLEDWELFARAYSQFVAKRAGHKGMLAAIKTRVEHEADFTQWPDAEFEAIEEAIEEVLRAAGYIG